MRILVAEDEKDPNKLISDRLKGEHYSVDTCFDGLGVLKTIRKKGISTPVLLLTARDSIEDRVQGLDADAETKLIHTVRGAGYVLRADDRSSRRESAGK